MTGELGDQRDLALHALEDDGINAVHVACDEREQRIERRRALCAYGMDCSGHGAAPSRDDADFKAGHQMWTRCSGGR